MRDLANITKKLEEQVERYMAKFRIERTKCATMMMEMDFFKLIQDSFYSDH